MRKAIASLMALLCTVSIAAADCGKIIIIIIIGPIPDWVMNNKNICPPDPPHPPDMTPPEPPPDVVPPVENMDTPPPQPCTDMDAKNSSIGDDTGSLGLFEEPKQLGFITWNGKEEILAIKTDEKTATKGAYMSILPLPGKALKITQGNNKMWNRAENEMYKAFHEAGVVSDNPNTLGLELETKIGAHNIFVWKVDSFKTFQQDIEAYLNKKYKGKAIPLIPKELKQIMNSYVQDKGFRYFAFDVVDQSGDENTKETILYHFETPKGELYYPLVISQSGGKGNTGIELLIVSNKEKLTFPDAGAKEVVTGKFKNHFDKYTRCKMTHDELAVVDKRLLKLFGEDEQLWGRWFSTKGDTDIRSFGDDFRLVEQR